MNQGLNNASELVEAKEELESLEDDMDMEFNYPIREQPKLTSGELEHLRGLLAQSVRAPIS